MLGYSSFGPYTHNPAEEIALGLNGSTIGGCKVIGVGLRVSASEVRGRVPRLLEEADPELALGVGLNPAASKPVLEAAAANLMHFEAPDMDGFKASVEPIDPDGPPVAHARLPIRRIHRECTGHRGLPLRVSVGIGSYLCNTLGYLVMRWASERGRLGGFLHVPPHSTLALRLGLGNSLPLHLMVELVECIIEESLRGPPSWYA